jgi:hypothetical protein
VHLTVDGRVVSHESSVRPVARREAVVGGDALLSPEEARASVEERLRGVGIDPARYTLARREFGYLRLGRSSVQSLVAPHYAFVYKPRPGRRPSVSSRPSRR